MTREKPGMRRNFFNFACVCEAVMKMAGKPHEVLRERSYFRRVCQRILAIASGAELARVPSISDG